MTVFTNAINDMCVYDKTSLIYVKDFKRAIEQYVYANYDSRDKYVHAKHKKELEKLGFKTIFRKYCKHCDQRPTGKRNKLCCPKYNRKNRINKPVIYNMRLKEPTNDEIDSFINVFLSLFGN